MHSTRSGRLGPAVRAGTHLAPRLITSTESASSPRSFSVLLTPVIVIAFAVAMLGVIGALTGWSPPIVQHTLSIDPLVEGDGFTKHRVIMIVVGLTVGYIAAAIARWAVHYRRVDASQPMSRRTA